MVAYIILRAGAVVLQQEGGNAAAMKVQEGSMRCKSDAKLVYALSPAWGLAWTGG